MAVTPRLLASIAVLVASWALAAAILFIGVFAAIPEEGSNDSASPAGVAVLGVGIVVLAVGGLVAQRVSRRPGLALAAPGLAAAIVATFLVIVAAS